MLSLIKEFIGKAKVLLDIFPQVQSLYILHSKPLHKFDFYPTFLYSVISIGMEKIKFKAIFINCISYSNKISQEYFAGYFENYIKPARETCSLLRIPTYLILSHSSYSIPFQVVAPCVLSTSVASTLQTISGLLLCIDIEMLWNALRAQHTSTIVTKYPTTIQLIAHPILWILVV